MLFSSTLYRRHRYLSEKNPRKRAPGRDRPYAPVWVIQVTRVQLATGLSRTREKPTSLPTALKNTPCNLNPKSFIKRGSASYTPVPTRNDDEPTYAPFSLRPDRHVGRRA